jgi:hypothetical protein
MVTLDDVDQPIPDAQRKGFLQFALPSSSPTCRLTVYRQISSGDVGIYVFDTRDGPGRAAISTLVEQHGEAILKELGGTAGIRERKGLRIFSEERRFGDLTDPAIRSEAIRWLAERTNTFVNVLRPAIRAAAADLEDLDR